MNYLKPGLREIARKLGRQRHRLGILLARRELTKAETALGLLGWQQADFDAETQSQVDKINAYEREQSRLTNEGAGLAKELRELRVERETARRSFDEHRRSLEVEKAGLSAGYPAIEKQLAEKRKIEPTFERRMPELDRELRDINKLYGDLISAVKQTSATKAEIARLRERTVAIASEKTELRNHHLRAVSDIRTLEADLEQGREKIAAIDKRLRELTAAFETEDSRLAAEIKSRERDKARLEKEINAIEGAKTNPYLQIGRVLADSDVAPMNQPGALDRVKRLRSKLVELDDVIQLSLQISAVEDAQTLRLSYLLLGTIAFVGLLLILAAVPRG